MACRAAGVAGGSSWLIVVGENSQSELQGADYHQRMAEPPVLPRSLQTGTAAPKRGQMTPDGPAHILEVVEAVLPVEAQVTTVPMEALVIALPMEALEMALPIEALKMALPMKEGGMIGPCLG